MAYPITLDSFTPKVDNTDDVMATDVNELQTAIEALEAKVGIDNSLDTDSFDYKIAQLESGKQDSLDKATGSEVNTGTDDTKYVTPKALKDSNNVPSVAPGTSGNVLTSNGTDWISATPSAGGADIIEVQMFS